MVRKSLRAIKFALILISVTNCTDNNFMPWQNADVVTASY